MKKGLIVMMLCACIVYMSTLVYAQGQSHRTIYRVNPGESYVLEGTLTTKDGKRKKVMLIVKAPQGGRASIKEPAIQENESIAPHVTQGISESPSQEFNISDYDTFSSVNPLF